MSTLDKPQYLIPKPTRRGYEVVPGWGMVEFAIVGGGLGIGGGFAVIASVIGLSIPLIAVVGILPAVAAGFLAFPPPNGEPLYRQVQAMRHFLRRPKVIRRDWRHTQTPD